MPPTDQTSPIKFYTSWTCPYAQRAWIALNHLNVKYDLIESFTIDKEKNVIVKGENLLKINQEGKVPTLDVNGEIVVESIDIIEYLHKFSGNAKVDPNFVTQELMNDAKLVNQNLCSVLYKVFLKGEESEQDDGWKEFLVGLETFTESIQEDGYFKSTSMNVVDITFVPWGHLLNLAEHYRAKSLDKNLAWVKKFICWYERMLSHKAVLDTVPDKEKLVESFRLTLLRMGGKV